MQIKTSLNGIAPGAVMTNIASSMKNISETGIKRQQLGMSINPRVGEPDKIANLAIFLGSGDARFINDQVITAEGGWTAY